MNEYIIITHKYISFRIYSSSIGLLPSVLLHLLRHIMLMFQPLWIAILIVNNPIFSGYPLIHIVILMPQMIQHSTSLS